MTPKPWYERLGYFMAREIEPGVAIALTRMVFTWRLLVCTEYTVLDFYCYARDDVIHAVAAYEAWDGKTEPLEGWVKHNGTGRHREHGDPATEEVYF